MHEVSFELGEIRLPERSVEPHLQLQLGIRAQGDFASGQLHAQVRLEPRRRSFSEHEEALLHPLFGPKALWARSETSMLWTQCPVLVPAFSDRGQVAIALPTGSALEHAIGKLLSALQGGALPVAINFRGTLFRRGAHGLDVVPVSHAIELGCEIPIALLRKSIDLSFGERRPLSVTREVYEQLCRYRLVKGAQSLDAALAQLLQHTETP